MNTTHGLWHHRLYHTWNDMKGRVLNPKHKYYKHYGARGITICDRWFHVKNFIEDMYPSYEEGLSIDRIDNDGNYEPSNCRWATNKIQQRNTRIIISTNTSGYRGVYFYKKKSKFATQISVNGKRIFLGYFDVAKEAGYAYDKYVIDNGLEHTTNGLYQRETK